MNTLTSPSPNRTAATTAPPQDVSAPGMQAVHRLVERTLDELHGRRQVLGERCVDVLLDLRHVAVEPVLRQLIDVRLTELAGVGVVPAEELRADLAAIIAIGTLEALFADGTG
jgi:hypothetical protein